MTKNPHSTYRAAYYVDIIAWGEGHNRIFGNVFEDEGKRSGISLNSVSNRVWSNTLVGCVTPFEYYPNKPGNVVTNNVVRPEPRAP